MAEGAGVVGVPACARCGSEEIEKEEGKDNAESTEVSQRRGGRSAGLES
jgi:hypothetical protein